MRKTASTLIGIVLALLAIGIVMLASTSSVRGSATYHDPHYFLKRQLLWLAVSLVVVAIVVRLDYHWWRKLAAPMAVACVVMLTLVLVPGIGTRIGGSARWLRVGPFSVQPSEFAKLAVVVALSAWMDAMGPHSSRIHFGLLLPVGGLGIVLVLLMLEPDFGTTILSGAVGFAVLFGGGTRLGYLAITGLMGFCVFVLAVLQDPLRLDRIRALFSPEDFPITAYHLVQSKASLIRGGWFGVGLGNSIQKEYYLPEAHTDFILAIIGEELGLLGTGSVILLFFAFSVCGAVICLRAPDPFGRLLAFGITVWISLQAVINVGVVTGCLPTKGLPLPFISYGGSSLLSSLCAVAVLASIALRSSGEYADEHTRLSRDRARSV